MYSHNDANMLLGCLMNDTDLITSKKYPLTKEDFSPNRLHRIIYGCVYNLAINGVKEITPMDVGEFIKTYPKQRKVLEDNDYLDFITTVKSLALNKNVEKYYIAVRKFSILRECQELGFPIDEIYDEQKDKDEQLRKLNEYSLKNITNHFEDKLNGIKRKFIVNDNIKRMYCGDDFDDFLAEVKETPMIGASLTSQYLNELYRGWCNGHLLLRGSPSSGGKTALGIAELCNIGAKKIWSEEHDDFIDNPCYLGKAAFIHTEQKSREEIQPRFISNISNIPYNIIMNGTFTPKQQARLSEAGKIMKQSELELINYADFTAQGLKILLKDLALSRQVGYVDFDYIWDNNNLTSELKSQTQSNVQSYMALMNLVNVLKMSAEDNDIAIKTSMQLNGNEKTVELIDEGCLAGSKQVKTKLDGGSIMLPPRKKEIAIAGEYLLKKGLEHKFVNRISHVFKARYNQHGLNIKVWHYLDTATGKLEDLFVTTWDNQPIKIPKLFIGKKT